MRLGLGAGAQRSPKAADRAGYRSTGAPFSWAGALLVWGCAVTPVDPPPPIDAARLAKASEARPGVVEDVRLLEWQAAEAAKRGDLDGAERYARLARMLLDGVDAGPARACAEGLEAGATTTSSTAVGQGAQAEVDGTSEAPPSERRRKRRRTREAPAAPVPPSGVSAETASVERRLQGYAKALSELEGRALDADERVWLDTGQRALIEAQRALAAGGLERSRQHLEKVDEAIRAIQSDGGARSLAASSTVAALEPLDALARDLAATDAAFERSGTWLVVPLPEARRPGHVTKRQRASLQTVGKLLRVYGAARTCVGTAPELKADDAQVARDAVAAHLQDVEQIDASRLVPCDQTLETQARLYLGLTFAARRRS